MNTLTGKLIVITGAAGGIGRACIDALGAAGARLLLIDRDGAALDRAAAARGAGPVYTACSSLDSPQACAQALSAVEGAVFALVHLAGIYESDELDARSRDAWDRTLAVNLTSAFDMAAACAARFDPRETSRMVFMTSVAYRRGSFDHLAYSASKGGVTGLVRALSRRLAPAVLVNALAPGVIDTPMPRPTIAQRSDRLLAEIPLKRWGDAREVAGVVRFLCGPDSTYITGQV